MPVLKSSFRNATLLEHNHHPIPRTIIGHLIEARTRTNCSQCYLNANYSTERALYKVINQVDGQRAVPLIPPVLNL
jgi:hypothetical protein